MTWIASAKHHALVNPNNKPPEPVWLTHAEPIELMSGSASLAPLEHPAPVQINISPTGPISQKTMKSITELVDEAAKAFNKDDFAKEKVLNALIDTNATLIQKVNSLIEPVNEPKSTQPVYDAIMVLAKRGLKLISMSSTENDPGKSYTAEIVLKVSYPDDHMLSQLKKAFVTLSAPTGT